MFVIANVRNLVILVNISIIQIVSVEKKLIDSLVEECTENIYVIKTDNENEHKNNIVPV